MTADRKPSILITNIACPSCGTRMGEQSGLHGACEWCGTELTSDVAARLLSALQQQF